MGLVCCFRLNAFTAPLIGCPSCPYRSGNKALCSCVLRSGCCVDSGRLRLAGSIGAGGATSTATVSVLANRLHRTAWNATRWAEARVQGIAADIGRVEACVLPPCGSASRNSETAYVSNRFRAPALSIRVASRKLPSTLV